MVTTTTLLCSKYSPQCIRVMDSLRKLNISLEPHIKLVWIDNPNVRNYVKSTQVKSVPCIVVHDEERDISILYENQRFTDYLNNFIQQRQSRVGAAPSQGIVPVGAHPPQPVAAQPHLAAMAGNQAFQAQHQKFAAQQQHTLNTLQQSQADLAVHQVHLTAPNPDTIRNNLSMQMFGSEKPPQPLSQSGLAGMKAMGMKLADDFKQHQVQNEMRKQNIPRLKEEALQRTAVHNLQMQEQIQANRQQRQQQMEAKTQEAQQLSKMSMATHLRQLPQYAGLSEQDLAVVVEEKSLSYQMTQLEQAQAQLTNLRQIHSANPEKVAEIDKELQNVAQAKLGLAQQRLALPQLQKPNELPFIQREEKSVVESLTKEHYVNDKLETDLSMTKKVQQKSGTTDISSLLGDSDDSLYDHMKRKGTDFHQSEAQMNTALSSTKRNSLNQRVREMSQTRPVQVERGAGHEQMAKSSMPVIPEKKLEMTPIDALEEDMIDSGEPNPMDDEPVVASAVKKKKSSALDMAREMEKSRGMLDKQFER